MRKITSGLIVFLLLLSFSLVHVSSAEAAQRVKGYTKKNGTYVQPHFKTPANSSKIDNFSTKGNINPFTGKKGTVSPYKITPKKRF